MPTSINKYFVQKRENPPKVLAPNLSKTQDTVVLIPILSYTMPQMKSRDDERSRKTIQDVSREVPIYPIQFIDPLLNQ